MDAVPKETIISRLSGSLFQGSFYVVTCTYNGFEFAFGRICDLGKSGKNLGLRFCEYSKGACVHCFRIFNKTDVSSPFLDEYIISPIVKK